MPNTSHTTKSKKNTPHTQRANESGKSGSAPPDAQNRERNEGEGGRTGARHHDAATEKHGRSGRDTATAQGTKGAVHAPGGEALRAAGRDGRRHGKGHE